MGEIPGETPRITSYNVCYTKLLRYRSAPRQPAPCGLAVNERTAASEQDNGRERVAVRAEPALAVGQLRGDVDFGDSWLEQGDDVEKRLV